MEPTPPRRRPKDHRSGVLNPFGTGDSSEQRTNWCSVLEVASAREDHRHPVLIARGDHLGILHGTAGLDDCGDTMTGRLVETVTEREESVGSQDTSPER